MPTPTSEKHLSSLIQLLLDDLLEIFDGPLTQEEHNWTMTLTDKVQEYLCRQFRLEESDEYRSELLDEHPHQQQSLKQLHREHQSLLREFAEIRNALGGSRRDAKLFHRLQGEFRLWVQRYRNHERRETQLLFDTWTVDLGAGE